MSRRVEVSLDGHECHAQLEDFTVEVCGCGEMRAEHDERGRCSKVTQAGPCRCSGFAVHHSRQHFSGWLLLPSQEPSERRDRRDGAA